MDMKGGLTFLMEVLVCQVDLYSMKQCSGRLGRTYLSGHDVGGVSFNLTAEVSRLITSRLHSRSREKGRKSSVS